LTTPPIGQPKASLLICSTFALGIGFLLGTLTTPRRMPPPIPAIRACATCRADRLRAAWARHLGAGADRRQEGRPVPVDHLHLSVQHDRTTRRHGAGGVHQGRTTYIGLQIVGRHLDDALVLRAAAAYEAAAPWKDKWPPMLAQMGL